MEEQNLGSINDELFQQIDLFENTQFMNIFMKNVYEKWEEKIANGLSYEDCEKFLSECENIGYTFQYELDANPFYLVPINKSEQLQILDKINEDKKARIFCADLLETLPNSEIVFLKQYAQSQKQHFENFDGSTESFNHIENYLKLDSQYESTTINKIEEIYRNNVYELNGNPNQIHVDLFIEVVEELNNKKLLSQLPDEIDGVKISDWQKEHLIKNGEVAIASLDQDDELQVRFNLEIDGNIKVFYPSGEENIISVDELLEKQKKEATKEELKIGNLAMYKNDNTFFKGKIDLISGDTVTLTNLIGESANFQKDQIYQFFPGQKYDRSEIEALFKVEPAGIKFSNLEKADITKLMKGELTNTLFKGYTEKDGGKIEYSFKMRPEYSKQQGKLTLKPYWKNKQEEIPMVAFGSNLSKEQIQEVKEGKSIVIDGISKDQKPFTVKAHYDKELNSFIADKFINNNELKKEEKVKIDLNQKNKGQKI